ncbi:MAG: hypothetical protein ACLVB5_03840 [Christensenellales bacterium]
MLLRGELWHDVFAPRSADSRQVQNVELTQYNIDLTALTPLKGRCGWLSGAPKEAGTLIACAALTSHKGRVASERMT